MHMVSLDLYLFCDVRAVLNFRFSLRVLLHFGERSERGAPRHLGCSVATWVYGAKRRKRNVSMSVETMKSCF